MSEDSKTDAETPMERALRLKKAAQAKSGRPGEGKFNAKAAAGMQAGASKPAMRK